MALLRKSEVILMQEDVLVYCFQQLNLPYHQDPELNARRLFTPCIGEAVLRFRCANERAYINHVRRQSSRQLLESSSLMICEYVRGQVETCFTNGEKNYMRFFRYLAFILDLTVFAYRYNKIRLMNPVFVECETIFHLYLRTEVGLPFWKNFMMLCDVVLRASSEHGRPIRQFRNPAVDWDPRDLTFNPDDPVYLWVPPRRRLDPNHPILKPDSYAWKMFWKDRGAENTDKRDVCLDLQEDTSNLSGESSNLVVERSNLGADASNIGVQGSNLGANASNLVVERSNLGADGSNIGVQISNLGADSSNLVVERSNIGADGSNIGVQGCNDGADTSNLVERSNLGDESSNIDVENSNLGTQNLETSAGNSSILSTGADKLNVGALNTPHDENLNIGAASSSPGDENLNIGAASSSPGDENLNIGDENSNSTNENSQPGAENIDTHPFDVLLEAMRWDIQDIIMNTDPEDPAFN